MTALLPVIVYLHGFNSSPASFKAGVLSERLARAGRAAEFAAPQLPPSPRRAIAVVQEVLARHPAAALVGSSLGGYYATWLAEQHGLRAVLVNPAVRPYELLRDYLGPQQNLHTGERYELTAGHLAELRELEVAQITRPERYLLLVATGDEVLDYRRAVEKYRGCAQVVAEGGDHAFGNFAACLDTVLRFCGIAA